MARTAGKPKSSETPKKKPGRKNAPTAEFDDLEQSKRRARSQHSQAKRTTEAYSGHIKRGRAFLDDLVAQRRERVAKEPSWVCPEGIDTDLAEKAFDTPNKHSAWALEMFLTQKCIVEGLGKHTAEGIHGAFAKHWDTMTGDKYSGPYHLDESSGIVTGCPARAQIIQTFLKVIKNKSGVKGAAATRNHAEAMTMADMKKWTEWSESKWPRATLDQKPRIASELQDKMKHFMMRAFGSSGFTLWTRNFELCALQIRDLTLDLVSPAPFKLPYFEVFLDNRKGWQNKQGFDNDSRESNRYNIYKQSDTPEIDMYTHLLAWLKLYEECLGRKLLPEDYVFPYIAPNGVIHPTREMTTQGCQDLINEFSRGAGLTKSYTTHSFRRGGAQYRFMWAPLGKRWSLQIVRWWGGWASGEQVDTLMRYLMDSLQSYETGHSDALCPISREADQSFMGDHQLVKPVATEEFRLVSAQLLKTLEELKLGNQTVTHVAGPSTSLVAQPAGGHSSAPMNTQNLDAASVITHNLRPPTEAPTLPATSNHPVVTPADVNLPLSKRVEIIPGVFIPDLKKGDFAWRDAVRQWEEGVPQDNVRPLRDWPTAWYTAGMREVTGAKRSQRKLIAEEYYRLGSDDEAFVEAYPIASKRIGTLIKAIQDSNKRLGKGQARRSKRGLESDE
ncbi:hypothetical protein C8R45DRAFT_843762 [Mycena sanguinolenta]|nr:hypothetical protein C8R45DRAFT_843762 [Mycena sanguinolenta]